MPSLYFFRHHITHKVLVSPRVLLEHTPHNRLLNQIGENRPQAKIRPDHWVPFAVLSGIPNQALADRILKLVVPQIYDDGFWLKKQTFPVYPKRLAGEKQSGGPAEYLKWRIPDMVREKTVLLCEVLNKPEITAELEMQSVLPETKDDKTEVGYRTSFLSIPFASSIASLFPKHLLRRLFPKKVTRPSLPRVKRVYAPQDGPPVAYSPLPVPDDVYSGASSSGITLHWEREEYQNLPLEQNMMWPFYVQHKKLRLIRNSWPVVEDFDCLNHKDKFSPEQASRHREEKLIRIGWNLDDHIRRRFPHSKKVSSKFRERLILNMTGGVKPRKIIRTVREEVRRRERIQRAVERAGLLGKVDLDALKL